MTDLNHSRHYAIRYAREDRSDTTTIMELAARYATFMADDDNAHIFALQYAREDAGGTDDTDAVLALADVYLTFFQGSPAQPLSAQAGH